MCCLWPLAFIPCLGGANSELERTKARFRAELDEVEKKLAALLEELEKKQTALQALENAAVVSSLA